MKQASVKVVPKTKDYFSNFDRIFRKEPEKNKDHCYHYFGNIRHSDGVRTCLNCGAEEQTEK